MQILRSTLEHLLQGRDLTEAQAADLLGQLTAPELAPAMAGALLAALRGKGVTSAELRGFAGAMRALARKPALPTALDAIDIVGTGGDSSGSLNLSTGAALLTAACGLPVVKHGNRSISSRSGSADLIEQLGFSLPLDERRAAECFAATGFTFLFAPYFHPAMKSLAAIRTALGVRTIFNLLGPLTNPAAPRFYLIGAYDAAAAELMADTLAGMDAERAWVIHGAAHRSVSGVRRAARRDSAPRNRSARVRLATVRVRRFGGRRRGREFSCATRRFRRPRSRRASRGIGSAMRPGTVHRGASRVHRSGHRSRELGVG